MCATKTSLLVRATWEKDWSPARGVEIVVRRTGVGFPTEDFVGVTGDDGLCRFEDPPRGRVLVGTDRWFGEQIHVRDGEETVADLRLPAGLAVSGVVVDRDDRPVKGAEIRLYFASKGRVVARTASDGAFALEHVREGAYVGARAAGHSPSTLVSIVDQGDRGGVTLRLVLSHFGGAIAGRIVDVNGNGIARAWVEVDDDDPPRQSVVGIRTTVRAPPSVVLRTNEEGEFHIDGLQVGDCRINARAEGYGVGYESLEILPQITHDVLLGLHPAATVEGVVRDAEGRPVAQAEVGVGENGDFDSTVATSGADGFYRLTNLQPGDLGLRAEGRRFDSENPINRGKAEVMISVSPGETARWDPVLSRGLELVGRVIDEAGRPMPHTVVVVHTPHARWHESTQPDEDGRFRIPNCPEGALDVSVYDGSFDPEASLADFEGIRAGPDEVLLTVTSAMMPSAFVICTVLDRDGRTHCKTRLSTIMAQAT